MSYNHLKNEYVNLAGLRQDGRRSTEVRRIRCRFGLFNVDGSAYYEQGNTKVIAVVYGPREMTSHSNAAETSDHATVNCEFSQATFATTERKTMKFGDRKKIEFSLAMKKTFETAIMTHLYPRTQIDIFVDILHADGGELSASINAVTLALIEAGISMKDYVVSCSAGFIQQNLLCDLNYVEESARCPELTIALNPRNNKMSLVQMESKIPLEAFEDLMSTATEGCKEIYDILRNEVKENTWRLIKAKDSQK